MGIEISGVDTVQQELSELEDQLSGNPAAVVGASASHAPDVEFGTDPHTIEADNAEALHFEWKGQEIFVTSVQHPGTEPQPYMRPAAREVRSNAAEYIETASDLSELVTIAAVAGVRFAKQKAPVDDGDLQNSIRWELL